MYYAKAEEQGKWTIPTNDENKEDDTVLKSSLQALRCNDWKRTDIAQSENLNEQIKTIKNNSVKRDPKKRNWALNMCNWKSFRLGTEMKITLNLSPQKTVVELKCSDAAGILRDIPSLN